MTRYLFLLLVGICGFVNAVVAEVTIRDSVVLQELTVTGTRFETTRNQVPFSVTQVSQQDIALSGQHHVLSALGAHVPGLFVTERNIFGFGVARGGSGAINIRGVGSAPNTQVLVLIDGHPQFQGIFGHPLADAYMSSDVQKVEVIRGPASVLYGSNAMGGVINIVTKKQEAEGMSGSVSAALGSYSTQKYSGTWGFKKDRFHLFASINYGSTNGIRENTDFRTSNGYLKAGYQLSDAWKVTVDANLANYKGNDNGPVFQPALFHIDILRGKAALSIENRYENTEGGIKIYHNFGTHVLSDGFESNDRNSGLMLYQTVNLSNGTFVTGGIDAAYYGGLANRGMSANQFKSVSELAAYVLLRQQVAQIFELNGGIRYHHHSLFQGEWIPMLGLTARPLPTTSLKAAVSKGFRSPTLMELFTFSPNPELKPEKMMNYELSWMQRFANGKVNTELTAFIAEGANLIQLSGSLPPKRENTGDFSHRGVEASISYTPFRHLLLRANYSFLHMEKPLLAAPKHQWNVMANYQMGIFGFNVHMQHIGDLYLKVHPSNNLVNSFTLLNARITARVFKNAELHLSGNNLFGEQYQINHGYPMPGLHVHGGVNLRF